MRILICPDKFAGTIGAADAARSIAAGWASAAPGDTLDVRPLADGGTGFVEILAASVPGRLIPVGSSDPLGRPVRAQILVAAETAYIESAQACGLHLLSREERDPRITTSYGLGALVSAAADAGAVDVVIGLGGSATNDGGAGFLAALGIAALDMDDVPLPPGGAALVRIGRLVPGARPDVRFIGATDVDNPLTGPLGATAVYGPQKGGTATDIKALDAALVRFVGVLQRDLGGSDLDSYPGAGAAGGLGAAILALGGELRSGIGLVRDLTGLDAALDRADLVITGEGSLDAQSLRGKVVAGVANAARDRGVPCVVLAGVNTADRREAQAAGIAEVHTLVEHFGSVNTAMARPAEGLFALAARLAEHPNSGRTVA